MAQTTDYFDNGEAYQRFMGRWTRAVGAVFLDWIAPPAGARWLDVGCGTGVFTELVLDTRAPSAVIAVDPTAEQIEHARRQPVAERAEFKVADAQNLPFHDKTFDIVACALVINFIPDRPRAMAEMRRVVRDGGIVAGYVWDFPAERSPAANLRTGLRQIGIEPPATPGTAAASLDALHALFAQAGFKDIVTRTIDVTMRFPNFDDLWRAQTPVFNPLTRTVAALPETDRMRLIEHVRALVPADADGSVACSARANAIKARVPS
jgi:ubiquinone/menaquinone biosynthesis C-methylase UbiE